jgi:hypothetical protein
MTRHVVDETELWDDDTDTATPGRSRWTLIGLVAMACALGLAFVLRGICWEALAIAAPVLIIIALVRRFRDVVLTVGVVVMLALGLVVLESVNVYTYHSVLQIGTPRIILWCGQELAPQGPLVSVSSDAGFEHLTDGGPVRTIGVTPAGSAIVASGSNASWGCPFQLYVAVGGNRWQQYTQDPM